MADWDCGVSGPPSPPAPRSATPESTWGAQTTSGDPPHAEGRPARRAAGEAFQQDVRDARYPRLRAAVEVVRAEVEPETA